MLPGDAPLVKRARARFDCTALSCLNTSPGVVLWWRLPPPPRPRLMVHYNVTMTAAPENRQRAHCLTRVVHKNNNNTNNKNENNIHGVPMLKIILSEYICNMYKEYLKLPKCRNIYPHNIFKFKNNFELITPFYGLAANKLFFF